MQSESSPITTNASQSPMDQICSSEDRNRVVDEEIKTRKKLYQEILQRQIEEQRMRKQKEQEKRIHDEWILEQ